MSFATKTLSKTPWSISLAIALIWAWLYLPFLGADELEREEGHRAIPTQEMWDRGDWVYPTYLNEPYLKKPPGFYWAIRVVSTPFGEVTHWSLRLTSAIGTLMGALLIGKWANDWTGNSLSSGIAFLVCPEIWMKGTQGEIDALFAVQVLVAAYFFWRSIRHSTGLGWALLAGLAMSWAILTKGPIALLFFYIGFGLWLAWEGRFKDFVTPRHLLFVIASLVPVVTWVYLLGQKISFETLFAVWSSEMSQTRAADTFWDEAKRVAVFPITLALAYLPGTYKIWELGKRAFANREHKSLWRFALAFSLPMFCLLMIHGRRARYTLPGGCVLPLLWAIPQDRPQLIDSLLKPKFVLPLLFVGGLAHAGGMWFDARETDLRDIASQLNAHLSDDELLVTDLDGDYIGLPFYLKGEFDELVPEEDLPEGRSRILCYTDSVQQYPGEKRELVTVDPGIAPSLTLLEIGGQP